MHAVSKKTAASSFCCAPKYSSGVRLHARPGLGSCNRRCVDLNAGRFKRQVQARYRVQPHDETFLKSLPLKIPDADLELLQRASTAWQQLCSQGSPQPPTVATQHPGPAPAGVAAGHYDVVVLGGTLGILLATALMATQQQQHQQQALGDKHDGGSSSIKEQQHGLRVAVVERGVLAGRAQEWNCTRADLQVLVSLGVLSAAEVDEVVVSHIPSVRLGVEGGPELTLTGVMDAGVSPVKLLQVLKRRFLELGGHLLEHTAFNQLDVFDDCAHLQLTQQHTTPHTAASAASGDSDAAGGAGARHAVFEPTTSAAGNRPAAATAAAGVRSSLVLSAAVVVDALGSFSPLSAQARGGATPEAAMLLMGSCVDAPPVGNQEAAAAGENISGAEEKAAAADVLWGKSPIDSVTCQQYWWERFPAAGGAAVTTYMFTFTDPAADNSQLMTQMVGHYVEKLGDYLGVPPSTLSVRRGVCGFVPCFNSRVVPLVDRLLPVGDSAANRSALSLAGFCALLRHLERLTAGLREALDTGATTRQELSLLQPWCPGVTATTAMQRTVSVYSSQYPAVRAAAAAAPGSSEDASVMSAVLSIMGASLAAMWDAVGEEGMRPFVADRIQLAPLATSMVTQMRRDAKQLLSYSVFLGDTRGASRLLTGLAGLWLYGLLHNATALTGPLHEALLGGSPRLLFRWHRYMDAWKYGSGNDWQQQQQQQQQEKDAGSTAVNSSSSSGSGIGGSSVRRPKVPAAAAAPVSHSLNLQQLAWGSSSRLRSPVAAAACAMHCQRLCVAAAASADAGSDGISRSNSSSSWALDDTMVQVEGRLDQCDLVDAFSREAIKQQGRPREDVYSYMEPPAAANSSSSAAVQPTFPTWCEPMQSMDCHDVIDWSDVENDGWGVPAADDTGSNGGSGSSTFDSSSGSNRLPPAAAAAVPGRGCSSHSSGLGWGGRMWRSPVAAGDLKGVRSTGSRGLCRQAVVMWATAGGKEASSKAGAEPDDATPHYEGADSDTLFPPGSLEMDDPGHPTEISGADSSKDTQAAVTRPQRKPYMNIVGGKWVPPSKAEAAQMMQQLSQTGPDEGV